MSVCGSRREKERECVCLCEMAEKGLRSSNNDGCVLCLEMAVQLTVCVFDAVLRGVISLAFCVKLMGHDGTLCSHFYLPFSLFR